MVKQIEEQNIEEGSTIEIETVASIQSSSSDTLVEKEVWSRKETLKFLKLYQKFHAKYTNKRKLLWILISKELARRNIFKSPERCTSKWKNLMRTYKSSTERNSLSRFQYYKAVDNIINGTPLILSDTDSEIESCDENLTLSNYDLENPNSKEYVEKAHWSRYQTIKFLQTFQKCELENKNSSKEQLWRIISDELTKEGIVKNPDKCCAKMKNLLRSYKKILEKDQEFPILRFKYFKEVDDLMNKKPISSPEDLSSDSEEDTDFFGKQ